MYVFFQDLYDKEHKAFFQSIALKKKKIVDKKKCEFYNVSFHRIYMVRSKESATVHSSKELHRRSFIVNVGKKRKKKD